MNIKHVLMCASIRYTSTTTTSATYLSPPTHLSTSLSTACFGVSSAVACTPAAVLPSMPSATPPPPPPSYIHYTVPPLPPPLPLPVTPANFRSSRSKGRDYRDGPMSAFQDRYDTDRIYLGCRYSVARM